MKVVKRDGSSEEVNVNKIVKAVGRHCKDLTDVEPLKIATKTINGLHDGATTRSLDQLSIQTAAALTAEDPQYAKLAARILASYIDKEVSGQEIQSFSQSVEASYYLGIASDGLLEFVKKHARKLNHAIHEERDGEFEYFGLRTLYDRYLTKHPTSRLVIETPQFFWMRIACALSDTVPEAINLYDLLSRLEYVTSSPTLFNAGLKKPQLSSCFLLDSPQDDLVSIYDRYKDVALLSKFAGGIGVAYHRVRSRRSLIRGTNGFSNGIVPWLKTLDSSVCSVNQGGKRKGACAVYLECWHADVEEFLELRDNTGDHDRRTYNLNLANWIPDIFMQRVRDGQDWSLFDPKDTPHLIDLYGNAFEAAYVKAESEGLAKRTIPARDLYSKMMRTLAQTGNGWMVFKDACNEKCNQTGYAGNVVHSSNLCVAPETLILTREGYVHIQSKVDQEVDVWNGHEWSKTTVRKTGVNQKLIEVSLSNGVVVSCTPYHKFILDDGERVEACSLKEGQKLVKSDWPVVEGGDDSTMSHPYTHGFFTGDGTYLKTDNEGNGRLPAITLYGPKVDLVPFLDIRRTSGNLDALGRLNVGLVDDLPRKFFVPLNSTIKTKLLWFAGLCDSDGTIARNGTNESLQIGSIRKEFLDEVRLMLTTIGVDSKVVKMRDGKVRSLPNGKGGYSDYPTAPIFRLLVTSVGLQRLLEAGIMFRRLDVKIRTPQRSADQFVKVISVRDTGRFDDTYCFHEPLRQAGVFNGVLTGNCSEITLVTSEKETAVCNLGSINLGRHTIKREDGSVVVDYDKLTCTVRRAIRQLDNVIDRNLYMIPSAETSNKRWRPVGLGIMGVQDVAFQMGLAFDSPEFREVSKSISEHIYYYALEASCDLAVEKGEFPAFGQSRTATGIFQFDLWDVKPSDKYDWDALRDRVISNGLRNSLLIATAPTATIASIAGCYECIEPQVSNLFKRETLSGDFLQVNKYLVSDLKKMGLWNDEIRNRIKLGDGSIQDIAEIPESLRKVYRTAWEIPMRAIIDIAADRGAFVDQSQSLNLFMENPNIGAMSSMYMYAWQKGLKSTYYLRSRPASKIGKATVVVEKKYTDEEAVVCSLENPEACEACS